METAADNSRTANRMSPTKDTALVHGLTSSPVPAAVIDESFGGLGIAVPLKLTGEEAVSELADRELNIEYGGVSCVAVIRHVATMESGCRLGLEWKAQSLSRCLRDLLKLQPNGGGEDLARILPGGLSMMWKLYEASRWHFLLDNTDRLRRQVASCGVTNLLEPIDLFQQTVLEVADAGGEMAEAKKDKVKTGLDDLIRQCIAAVS